MARRIKTLAKIIENLGFQVEVCKGHCNTDRKIHYGRIRIPGRGRDGTRLIVRNKRGDVVFDHNSAETYRCNQEVEDWISTFCGSDGNGPNLKESRE